MKALWLESESLTFRRDLEVPPPPEGEALVKVRLAGICGTDLELVQGYYPFTGIPGHEFVGEIVEAPKEPHRIGQRVVGEINAVCRDCRWCHAGRPTHCENRTVLGIVNRNGAFAEYLTLPLQNLVEVPESVSDEAAVFTEPLAAALQITQQVSIRPEHRVLIVGAGRLGQLIARTLVLTGCRLQIVTRYASQRRLLEPLAVSSIDESAVPFARADRVVEATGSPGGLELALRGVRPRGKIILKSTYKGKAHVDLPRVVVDEVSLVGSRCGPFLPALRLLERGIVDPLPLVAGKFPLDAGLEAFRVAGEPGKLKVLLSA